MALAVFWIFLAALLIAIELSTTQMYCLWFAVGALAAAFAAFAGAPLLVTLFIFLVCSVVTFVFGRPLLVEKVLPKRQALSGTERVIGQMGSVVEEIDNTKGMGRVKVSGLLWSARSEDGDRISPNTKVEVLRVEGVKLIVRTACEESFGDNSAADTVE